MKYITKSLPTALRQVGKAFAVKGNIDEKAVYAESVANVKSGEAERLELNPRMTGLSMLQLVKVDEMASPGFDGGAG